MLETANLIVLRKTPYKETSLIVSGISPDFGKLDLLARGERKLSKKHFPAFDLFREVQVSFSETGKSELHTVTDAELVKSFDQVALIPDNFQFAANVGSFLLKNSAPQLPSPLTYDAYRNILENLCLVAQKQPAPWSIKQCSVIIKSTYLYENGLLPEDFSSDNSRDQKFHELLEAIIAAGNEGAPLPKCPENYWPHLDKWLNSIIKYHQLQL
jgi:hypothetical protein